MQGRAILLGLSVCLMAAWTGCSQQASPLTSEARIDRDLSSVTLEKADEKALAETVESLKGKVVLVDYWATWCGPCVASFPHTVEIGKQFEAKGLAVVTISFDYLDEQNKARAFLSQHETDTFVNLISSYDGPNSDASDAFKVDGFPTLRLYDRSGKMVWENMGTLNAGEERALKDRIAKLLASQGA